MTGIVEMSSISSWKYGLSGGDIDNFNDVESRNQDSEMPEIPTWKRELMTKRSRNVHQESKKTCVFDSSSISPVVSSNSKSIIDINSPNNSPREPSVSEKNEEKVYVINTLKTETDIKGQTSSQATMGIDTKSSNGNVVKKNRKLVNTVETSHLKHVHSNPFFEKLGVDHPHGHIYDDSTNNGLSNGVSADDDDNEIQAEYAPNSGFVDKLKQKFSKLNQQKTFKSPRRFASLESLVDIGKRKNNELKSTYDRSSDKNKKHDKTYDINVSSSNTVTKPKLRSAPKVPLHRPRISSADEASKTVSSDKKSEQLQSEHVSIDFMKGRDDIVIIEQEMNDQQSTARKNEETSAQESGVIKSLKEEKQTADLPKPNTVINFRSLFEKRVSNTQKNILPDSYVSKFKSNLPNRKPAPPRPVVPPKRVSQDLTDKVSTVNDELKVSKERDLLESTDENENKSIEKDDSSTSKSVKDLTVLFRHKPERPFESPKSKRRSPEKKAIFDSSAIAQVREDIIVKEDRRTISPRSVTTEKPAISIKKPERITKSKPTPQVHVKDTSVTNEKSLKINSTKQEVKSPVDTAPLFPKRKQIFDSSNLSDVGSTPVAPPRVKTQKVIRKQAPLPENSEKLKSIKNSNSSQSQTINITQDQNLINSYEKERPASPSSVSTPRLSVQEINERNKQKQEEAEKHLRQISQNSIEKDKNKAEQVTNDKENHETPTRGVPSIIAAKRLNKSANKVNLGKGIIPLTSANDEESEEEEEEPRLVKPSQLRSTSSTPSTKESTKNDKSENLNFKNALKASSKNNQVPRTNIDDLIRGHKKPSAVFDSSNMAPMPKPVINGVPPLNLADLVDDKPLDHPYQEGYIPTKIAPCNYVFEGAGVKLKTTPLLKRRKNKGKISFHEDPKLHEYQSEGAALKDYLEENPHETEEAKKEAEEVVNIGDSLGESSDDVDISPREESTIKSNTPLSHSTGELTNYRSKYQTEDFQFGMSFNEPEPEPVKNEKEHVENGEDESMDLRPADEDDTINYTDSSISDMLF